MSNIFNCKRCGKIFQYSGKPICPDCVKKEDEAFEIARAYIKENPGHNMQEVSEATEIPIKTLTRFLREGRIEFSDGTTSYLSCQTCGTPIQSGRFCNNCLSKLGKEIMGAVPSPKPVQTETSKRVKERMHISKLRNDK